MKLKRYFALMLLVGLVYADDYSGAYYNLNGGVGSFTNLANGEPGGSLNAGYNFNRYFALEGGYTLLSGGQLDDTVHSTSNIFDVAVKGVLPMGNVFGLYGRLGAGYMLNSWSGTIVDNPNCGFCSDNSNFAVGLAGVGASFALNRSFEIHVEDTLFRPFGASATGNINTVMLGFQYNFDKGNKATNCETSNDYSKLPQVMIINNYESINYVNENTEHEKLHSSSHDKHHLGCTYEKHKFHFTFDAQGKKYLDIHECDTLYWAAKKTGVSVEELKAINHLESDKIEIGNKLYLHK